METALKVIFPHVHGEIGLQQRASLYVKTNNSQTPVGIRVQGLDVYGQELRLCPKQKKDHDCVTKTLNEELFVGGAKVDVTFYCKGLNSGGCKTKKPARVCLFVTIDYEDGSCQNLTSLLFTVKGNRRATNHKKIDKEKPVSTNSFSCLTSGVTIEKKFRDNVLSPPVHTISQTPQKSTHNQTNKIHVRNIHSQTPLPTSPNIPSHASHRVHPSTITVSQSSHELSSENLWHSPHNLHPPRDQTYYIIKPTTIMRQQYYTEPHYYSSPPNMGNYSERSVGTVMYENVYSIPPDDDDTFTTRHMNEYTSPMVDSSYVEFPCRSRYMNCNFPTEPFGPIYHETPAVPYHVKVDNRHHHDVGNLPEKPYRGEYPIQGRKRSFDFPPDQEIYKKMRIVQHPNR